MYPSYVFETGHGSFGQDCNRIALVNETVFAAGADFYDARFGLQQSRFTSVVALTIGS